MSKKTFSLQLQDRLITYEIEKKSVKRMTLRVRVDGSVHLSVPQRVSFEQAQRFALDNAAWIEKQLKRTEQNPTTKDKIPQDGDVFYLQGRPYTLLLRQGGRVRVIWNEDTLSVFLKDVEDRTALVCALRRFVKAQAASFLRERVEQIYPKFAPCPAHLPTLSFRWMRSRWGSCTAKKNRITLNEKLLFVPTELADYVIYHELCHFRHQNHSPAYYRHLSCFVPHYKELRARLAKTSIPNLEYT